MLKDYIHFYIMLGAIPLGLIVALANIFKGPAVLKPIPEGITYVEKLTRFKKNFC